MRYKNQKKPLIRRKNWRRLEPSHLPYPSPTSPWGQRESRLFDTVSGRSITDRGDVTRFPGQPCSLRCFLDIQRALNTTKEIFQKQNQARVRTDHLSRRSATTNCARTAPHVKRLPAAPYLPPPVHFPFIALSCTPASFKPLTSN